MNRELIYSALFAQLAAIPGLKTSSRKLKHWVDVPAEDQPALFLAQGNEACSTPTPGAPNKWQLAPSVYVYVNTAGEAYPGAVLNPILDAIEGVMNQRHPLTKQNNLGGVPGVEWARIDGGVDTDEGTLGDQAVAIIPIAILVTD